MISPSNDLHQSLDSTIAAIRAEHAEAMQACRDRTLAAEVEATILREQLAKATEARFAAERLSVKLVTQFSTVEKIFAEAKALAQAAYAEEPIKGSMTTVLPPNDLQSSFADVQARLEAKTEAGNKANKGKPCGTCGGNIVGDCNATCKDKYAQQQSGSGGGGTAQGYTTVQTIDWGVGASAWPNIEQQRRR